MSGFGNSVNYLACKAVHRYIPSIPPNAMSSEPRKDYVLDTVGIMLGLRSTSSEISPEERASAAQRYVQPTSGSICIGPPFNCVESPTAAVSMETTSQLPLWKGTPDVFTNMSGNLPCRV